MFFNILLFLSTYLNTYLPTFCQATYINLLNKLNLRLTQSLFAGISFATTYVILYEPGHVCHL